MAAETVELGTIYLVDLVGSTRLATSVGPVRWDEMREQFFGLLREAIDASGGREFKNTGDGLMVAFASASAAVGCAVLTQQLFERRYRGAEQRLRVRRHAPAGDFRRDRSDTLRQACLPRVAGKPGGTLHDGPGRTRGGLPRALLDAR